MSNLNEEVAKMPMVSTPAMLPSLSQPTPMATYLLISSQRKKRLGPGLEMVLNYMQAPLKSGQL